MTASALLQDIGWFLLASWTFFALRIGANVAKAPQRGAALRAHVIGLFGIAVVCAFVGIVFIAIGIGAMFPRLDMIGTPLSCPDGHVDVLSQAYSYRPGQHGRVTSIECLHASGERETVTFLTILYAGLVYSAVLMTILLWSGKLGLRLWKHKSNSGPGLPTTPAVVTTRTNAAPPDTGHISARLQALKQLHDAGLIDAAVYKDRQAEILKDL
jgi:hypothetical protein